MSPAWVEHAIWWHVYPLGFAGADTTGADRTPRHRFDHVQRWLDYLIDLGANGLALGPVFASSSHGYDTIDHFRVDPRLGDEADLIALFDAAHARGVRVVLDGVFNHVGREFPAFVRATESPDAAESSWFRWDAPGRPATFEGHQPLVALNHDSPAVQDYVVAVMTHWLDRGADGWRLDAAYAVPSSFWAAVLPRVRARHPDAYLFGEVLHGDFSTVIAESTMDSLTQYELWKAAWSSIEDRNYFELDWTLRRHARFLETFVPYTFLGNHDVTRVASQITDPRHRAHALVVLLTVGGTPAIYYGDEQGWTAVKQRRAGGDDAIRPQFPASPADLDPSGAHVFALHRELIALRRRHPWLHRACTETLAVTNTGYVYRTSAGSDALVVALNIDDEPLAVEIGRCELIAGSARRRRDEWQVPGHGWAVFG